MEKIIELKNLTKNLMTSRFWKGINLDIHHNQVLTLLGPERLRQNNNAAYYCRFREASLAGK